MIGVLAGVVWVAYPPAVSDDQYSYPFTATGFAIAQIVYFVQRLGLVILLAALWRTTGNSKLGRIGVVGSALGMLGLGALELVSITAKDSDAIGGSYGMISLAVGVFLIFTGIATRRAKTWPGTLPILLGIYVFVPMTPAILGPFALGQLAIAGWMALFTLLAWRLLRRTP